MATIHKFELRFAEVTVLNLPLGAQICCVDLQFGHVQVWVMVDVDEPYVVPYEFMIVGTGQQIPDGFVPVSTFFDLAYVWHACVRIGALPKKAAHE